MCLTIFGLYFIILYNTTGISHLNVKKKEVNVSLVVVQRTDFFMDHTNIELWFVELPVISYSLNTQCSVLIDCACVVIIFI